MAKQVIETTRQYLPGTGITKARLGTFVATGAVVANPDLATDFPISCVPPADNGVPNTLAGVLLAITGQGCRVGRRGIYKVKKLSTLTVSVGDGVLTVGDDGEIKTAGPAGHGEILKVEGDDVWIDINFPLQYFELVMC